MTNDDAGSAPEADADSTRFSSPATEPAPAESTPTATNRSAPGASGTKATVPLSVTLSPSTVADGAAGRA